MYNTLLNSFTFWNVLASIYDLYQLFVRFTTLKVFANSDSNWKNNYV